MKRRDFQALLWSVPVAFLLPKTAFAGSYLTRAALLILAAERESEALRRRTTDKELARVVHRLALARVTGAREMEVPKEVAPAHPHLLLLLEAYERSADSAVRGEGSACLVAASRAREETVTFRAVLKEKGYELTNLG